MADRPTTSRVGRSRSRSVSQTQKSTAKIGRPRSKSVQKPTAKGVGKKTTASTKTTVRPILQLEHDVVQVKQRSFGDQLPDLPTLDLEQDNIPLSPPNQPQDLPVGEENQWHQAEEPNQVPNPSPNQPNQSPYPVWNLPAAMAHPQ